jgi:hypothetical protein
MYLCCRFRLKELETLRVGEANCREDQEPQDDCYTVAEMIHRPPLFIFGAGLS